MRQAITAIALAILVAVWAFAFEVDAVCKWVDTDGVPHYAVIASAQCTEREKQRRDDSASSATHQTVESFLHRQRCFEVFHTQATVTEL